MGSDYALGRPESSLDRLMDREARLAEDEAEVYATFYRPEDPLGWASNFSRHGIWTINPWTGKEELYMTGEHRFQAMKATSLKDHLYVKRQPSPYLAKEAGREITLREGWGDDIGDTCYLVMFELVMTKALQHSVISDELTQMPYVHIYEDSPIDDIWGWRYHGDYRGKNLLGQCWMQVRDLLINIK